MFINRAEDGKNNVCGTALTKYRKKRRMSQRQLAELFQLKGLDVDKNAIQRIESGQRFVTDIELTVFSRVLQLSYTELLNGDF